VQARSAAPPGPDGAGPGNARPGSAGPGSARPGSAGPEMTVLARPVVPGPAPASIPPGGNVLQGRPGDPPPWRGRRFPVWLPFAAALVLVLGGLAAWYLTGSDSAKPLAGHSATPGQPSPGGGSAQAATAHPSATGAPSQSGSPPPSASAPATAAATGGSTVVALGPGVSGQPAAAPIAAFLGQYFTAVNEHDYRAFISLFTPAAQQNQSPQTFSSGSGTSRDSGEALVALSPARHGKTAAAITFVSHQDPSESATHTACTTWSITLYLRPAGTSYLIGVPPSTYQASREPCP
jgi:hypothetical protein